LEAARDKDLPTAVAIPKQQQQQPEPIPPPPSQQPDPMPEPEPDAPKSEPAREPEPEPEPAREPEPDAPMESDKAKSEPGPADLQETDFTEWFRGRVKEARDDQRERSTREPKRKAEGGNVAEPPTKSMRRSPVDEKAEQEQKRRLEANWEQLRENKKTRMTIKLPAEATAEWAVRQAALEDHETVGAQGVKEDERAAVSQSVVEGEKALDEFNERAKSAFMANRERWNKLLEQKRVQDKLKEEMAAADETARQETNTALRKTLEILRERRREEDAELRRRIQESNDALELLQKATFGIKIPVGLGQAFVDRKNRLMQAINDANQIAGQLVEDAHANEQAEQILYEEVFGDIEETQTRMRTAEDPAAVRAEAAAAESGVDPTGDMDTTPEGDVPGSAESEAAMQKVEGQAHKRRVTQGFGNIAERLRAKVGAKYAELDAAHAKHVEVMERRARDSELMPPPLMSSREMETIGKAFVADEVDRIDAELDRQTQEKMKQQAQEAAKLEETQEAGRAAVAEQEPGTYEQVRGGIEEKRRKAMARLQKSLQREADEAAQVAAEIQEQEGGEALVSGNYALALMIAMPGVFDEGDYDGLQDLDAMMNQQARAQAAREATERESKEFSAWLDAHRWKRAERAAARVTTFADQLSRSVPSPGHDKKVQEAVAEKIEAEVNEAVKESPGEKEKMQQAVDLAFAELWASHREKHRARIQKQQAEEKEAAEAAEKEVTTGNERRGPGGGKTKRLRLMTPARAGETDMERLGREIIENGQRLYAQRMRARREADKVDKSGIFVESKTAASASTPPTLVLR